MGMLYELDDIEKRALVMEIKPDPVDEAREPPDIKAALRKLQDAAWNCGTDEYRDSVSDAAPTRRYDAMVQARAACVVAADALIARIESQAEDIRFLGDRLEVQADVMSKVVAERDQLREALRSVPLLVEAAKGILNVHTWRGKKGYEAAIRDGIRELQAAVKDVPDVAGMLLNLAALSPKGEQKK